MPVFESRCGRAARYAEARAGQGDHGRDGAIASTTPEATIVIFDDVAKENWAQGGVLASEA